MAYRSCLENSRPVTGSGSSNLSSSATESCRSGRTELTANQLIELFDPWVRIPDSPPQGAIVYRLGRRPFKAKRRVQLSLALPNNFKKEVDKSKSVVIQLSQQDSNLTTEYVRRSQAQPGSRLYRLAYNGSGEHS